MPRLFIAIPLPAEVKRLIAALRTDLQGARWVAPEQAHLTLHFLGEISDSLLPPLAAAVTSLTTPSFILTTGGLGVFPSQHQPRVLWLGLEPSPSLQRLQDELNVAVASAGPLQEERTFSPHLTLARLKDTPPAAIKTLLNQQTRIQPITFAVDRVILYASILGQGGARHIPQATGMLVDFAEHAD